MATEKAARPLAPPRTLDARVRLIVLVAVACAAAWLVAMTQIGVWRMDLMLSRRVNSAMTEARAVAGSSAQALDRRFEALRTIPVLLAGDERLGRTLAEFDLLARMVPHNLWEKLLWRDDMLQLSRELAGLAESLNLEGIYLVAADGYVVASSDGERSDGHLGSSFAGRDHFETAMVEGQAEGFGVDPLGAAPMFYFTHRIERGAFHEGAVIVATSSPRVLSRIYRGIETVYLSDRNDVVVVASDADLLYRSLGDGTDAMSSKDRQLRYGRDSFEPVPGESEDGGLDALLASGSVHVDAPVGQERMTIHIVSPLHDLEQARRDNLAATLGLALLGVLLTGLVAVALVQFATMRERATRDPLTGLSNRRYADEILPELLALDDRDRVPGLAFVSFDLDHFKQVNDTWGHGVGDRVLRRFAQILQQSARRADLVFRYGGEEFTVVLVERDIHGAKAFAERVRAATAAIDDLAPVPPHGIRVSAGVVMRRDGETLEEVVKRADAMLYSAKSNGRDRVESDPA